MRGGIFLFPESAIYFALSGKRGKIPEGAVAVNSERVTQPDGLLTIKDGDVLRPGKRKFKKVVVSAPGKK